MSDLIFIELSSGLFYIFKNLFHICKKDKYSDILPNAKAVGVLRFG